MAKKQSTYIVAWLCILAGIAIVAYYMAYRYIPTRTTKHNTTFVYYRDFGIDLPAGYSIHGIDVSRHQEKINWPAVQQMEAEGIQIKFAFIKATEGVTLVDKNFSTNWKGAKNAGIIRGAYHYFLASKDGDLQAKNFLKTVRLQAGDLPPVLDVEELNGVSPNVLRDRMQAWLQAIHDAYGVDPIIYSSADFYNKYLDGYFPANPVWVAHYFEKMQPRVHADWIFWQHSSEGHVRGISEKVDFNVFAGDSMAFRKLLLR